MCDMGSLRAASLLARQLALPARLARLALQLKCEQEMVDLLLGFRY